MVSDRKYLQSAKKMDRYKKQKKVGSFSVVDEVSLRIPRIDQSSSDLSHLPCAVVRAVGQAQSLYCLTL